MCSPRGPAVVTELHNVAGTDTEIIPVPPFVPWASKSPFQFFYSLNKHRAIIPHQTLCIDAPRLHDKVPQTERPKPTKFILSQF